MARPKSANPKSSSRRQAEYRERKKAAGLVRETRWVDPSLAALDEKSEAEKALEREWRQQLRDEELKAARKAGREREREKFYMNGRIRAFVGVLNFFVDKNRPDIAVALVKEFYIQRADCIECGIDNMNMKLLDQFNVFGEQKDRAPGTA
ncbi:MAG: hypothetical protein LBF78_06160 [Treponema sp.]|jgi:hypothetical protein|nr:hypothetical protein [Treponema sp.]